MAMSKKLADTISRRINGLMVYKMMVNASKGENDLDGMLHAMQWYNSEADELIGLGIEVIKYKGVYQI
jgi:hypothetical protein